MTAPQLIRVISLTKRPAGHTPAAFWQQQRARANETNWCAALQQSGCIMWTQSQPINTEYAAQDPVADWVDEYDFADIASAESWRRQLFAHTPDALMALTDVVIAKACPAHLNPNSLTRVLRFAKKREDLTTSQFRRYWKDSHAPIACASPFLSHYVQLHVNDWEYQQQPPKWDGFTLSCFTAIEDISAHAQHPAGAEAAKDTQHFLSPTPSPRLIIQCAATIQPT